MVKSYTIIPPPIPSAGVYYFTTDLDVKYEVRFGRRQHDLLSATIVFGVLNEEYEGEEYVVTNKGDVFRVMATIEEIVNIFKKEHPNIRSYEFTGEPAGSESENLPTKRIRMYKRYAERIFHDGWNIRQNSNKIIVTRPMSQS